LFEFFFVSIVKSCRRNEESGRQRNGGCAETAIAGIRFEFRFCDAQGGAGFK